MATLSDEIKTNLAQRQQTRTRCAQSIATMLAEPALTTVARQLVDRALQLLHEDTCDLNGTPGVRTAIGVERTAWERLQPITAGALSTEECRQAETLLETIKRVIAVQATLIELAIPDQSCPLQDLYDEYQQRYGNPPAD